MANSNGGQTVAYLLIEVPARMSGNVAHRLVAEHRQSVLEAHVIWGESDIIAKVIVGNSKELADLVMNKIQKMTGVSSTRTFIAIDHMSYRADEAVNPQKSDVDAFIFISVNAARSEEVAEFLVEKFPAMVLETRAVWGGADVIARITAPSLTHLSELIIGSIQNVQHVSVTRTYLLIPGLSEYSDDMMQVYEAT